MSKKLTYEYIKEEFNKEGYVLISTEYINARTKLQTICPNGHEYEATWNNFSKGKRCKKCSKYKKPSYEYIKECFENEGYTLISKEYINCKTKMQTICPNGHKWETTWSNFYNQGYRCNKCAGQVATLETCIATTDPWMLEFLKNKEDGYNYSYGSHKKIDVVCPYCGKEKKMKICDIYRYKGVCCKNCGDGVSYPENFIVCLLNQLNIKYEREYSPKWIENKRYDFYLPNYNIIIETHGMQHYKTQRRGRTLEEEQNNDEYKKELALKNGIDNYIILDCRESNIEYIKNSIMNSELKSIFDLKEVNWLNCEEFSINSNLIKEVCDYWNNKNEWETTTDLAKNFNLSKSTIRKYLKKGFKLNWCNYNGKEELKKGRNKLGKKLGKPIEIFKDEKSLGIFSSCNELSKQSVKLFGVKLLSQTISEVCNGKRKTHKGFTFRYITKEEYEERIKQIKNNN